MEENQIKKSQKHSKPTFKVTPDTCLDKLTEKLILTCKKRQRKNLYLYLQQEIHCISLSFGLPLSVKFSQPHLAVSLFGFDQKIFLPDYGIHFMLQFLILSPKSSISQSYLIFPYTSQTVIQTKRKLSVSIFISLPLYFLFCLR